MPHYVKVTAVPFGPPESGLWCNLCFLPSVVRQKFVIQAGLSILSVLPPYEFCMEHEQTAEL